MGRLFRRVSRALTGHWAWPSRAGCLPRHGHGPASLAPELPLSASTLDRAFPQEPVWVLGILHRIKPPEIKGRGFQGLREGARKVVAIRLRNDGFTFSYRRVANDCKWPLAIIPPVIQPSPPHIQPSFHAARVSGAPASSMPCAWQGWPGGPQSSAWMPWLGYNWVMWG